MKNLMKILLMASLVFFWGPSPQAAEMINLTSSKVNSAPGIDGSGTDAQWENAKAIKVQAEDGPEIVIKSVFTEDEIFFLVQWEDLSESIDKDQWVYDGAKWNIKQEERIDETLKVADTDRLGFQWPVKDAAFIKEFTEKGCKAACHSPEKEDKMYNSSPGQISDIWRWDAALTNPLKFADDWHQDHTNISLKQEPDKIKRITAGQRGDGPGKGELIFIRNENDKAPKWMPKDGPNKPFFIKGEEIPLDMSVIKKGDTIPGWLLPEPKESRGSINAVGKYYFDEIIWVVELSRKLVTDDKDHDVQFDDLKKAYYFGVATWENDGLQTHTLVKLPFALTFMK